MVHDSVIRMWKEYMASIGEPETSKTYTAWKFGLTPEHADELSGLVLEGRKRATAGLLCSYEHDNDPVPRAGDLSIILDGKCEATCIIRATAVTIVPFNRVSEEFAWKEGEADRSLESWKDIHGRFFTAEMQAAGKKFSEDMDVVCEEFEVVFQ